MASIKANCRKIVCIGRNYEEHIRELRSASSGKSPFFFLKPPTSLLPPSSQPIIRPRGVLLHHELELGLIISQSVKNFPLTASPDEVDSVIGAYVLAIDLTARNVQDQAKKKGLPWTIAKGFDTFCPISDRIPKGRLAGTGLLEDGKEGSGVGLWLKVNGVEKQRGNTRDMLFGVSRILGEISRVMTLEEGDLVLTGTPAGVGELKEGDRVECGLEVRGEEVKEGRIEVDVVDAQGNDGYEFKET